MVMVRYRWVKGPVGERYSIGLIVDVDVDARVGRY